MRLSPIDLKELKNSWHALFAVAWLTVCMIGCDTPPDTKATATDAKSHNPAVESPAAPSEKSVVAPPMADSETLPLKVDVVGFLNDRGKCRLAVYSGAKQFNRPEHAIAKESIAIEKDRAVWFVDIDPKKAQIKSNGKAIELSIAVFHDENENERLDKNGFGIPTENYGFSNNPKRGFGPPAYAETVLTFDIPEQKTDTAEPKVVSIKVQ